MKHVTERRTPSLIGLLGPPVIGVALAVASVCCLGPAAGAWAARWTTAGQGLSNSRTQPEESVITAANAAKLAPRWVFRAHGDVSATPTVYGGIVYFPDWGGYLNAVSARTGRLIWQKPVSSYDGNPKGGARVSPAVYGRELIVGDNIVEDHTGGAHVFAVNRLTGQLLWSTEVEGTRPRTSRPIRSSSPAR